MINFTRLKDIREDNDLNQENMAKILKINRSRYSLWELGINIIPLNSLCDFADYFNFSLDYILGLNNDRKKKKAVKGLDLKVLGENLKQVRLKHNLSQENIANILGVSQACIAKYEKGQISISVAKLYIFSKEFNVSISSLCNKK